MECPICRTEIRPEGSGSCAHCEPPTMLPGAPLADAPTIGATSLTLPRAPRTGDDHTGPLDVGQAFGSRYHIIRLLGTGGMGAVYQAWDAELGVAVAIKVIRPSIMAEPGAASEVERRFKRELLLARQVTHPNVVRIHDLGEIDGIKYITMSYVDGLDLATRLKREGKPSIADTLSIARSVVSGLVAAHAAGVVHRDLKPANIMIQRDGDALIMDFGIAHSTGTATVSHAVHHIPEHLRRAVIDAATMNAGAVVGTLEYMAPEQARGLAVDQRADIYSFGLILYDMLLGRQRAEHGQSALAELQRRLTAPPPLEPLASEVPAPVAQLVARCVEPEAEKRFQTSAELAAALARLDATGALIPERHHLTRRFVAGAALFVVALLAGTSFLTRRAVQPAQEHEPVSVVIASIENRTGDPAFDRTLEPMLRRALEEASFISAYDQSRIRPVFGVQPPERFDEAAARELAANQGAGVVLAGFIDRRGSGYEISVRAAHPVTREVLGDATARAARKDAVLDVATRLAARLRRALGDETSESAQLFAMRTISATSLDAVSHYAAAVEAQSQGRYEAAYDAYLKATQVDPKFGIAYQGLAVMSRNLGRLEDAETYIAEALRYIDRMTPRELLSTKGYYYRVQGDYEQCVKEYGELVARYAADTVARNSRASCLARLRKMSEALAEMQQAVSTLPKHVVYRGNLAMLAAYAGNFELAEREARTIQPPTDLATQALAFAQLGQGLLPEAERTYQQLAALSARGASAAASGLGDLAAYQGRFADAIRIFEEGAAQDLSARNAAAAAVKLTSAASARLARGEKAAALAAAERALGHNGGTPVKFLAARIFAEAGAATRAAALAAALGAQPAAEARAYGKIVEAETALAAGNAAQAIVLLNEANALVDTWLGRFDLGRAYLAAGQPLQADSEFQRCLERRGESLSLLADDPTYSYFPAVYYYRGRAREALGTEGFADSYREYLAIRGASADDPRVTELRPYQRP